MVRTENRRWVKFPIHTWIFLLRGRSSEYSPTKKNELTSLLHWFALLICFVNKITSLHRAFTFFFGDSYQDHLLLSINDWISSTHPLTDTSNASPQNYTEFVKGDFLIHKNYFLPISCCCRSKHVHSTSSSWDEWASKLRKHTERNTTSSAMFEKVRWLLHYWVGCAMFEYVGRAFVSWSLSRWWVFMLKTNNLKNLFALIILY